MNIAWGLIVTLTLLLLNTFSIAGGFTTTSIQRSQIETLETEGARGPAHAIYAPEHVSLILAICQLGMTTASAAPGLVTELTVVKFAEGPLIALGASVSPAHLVVFLLVLTLVLFLHVVFAETAPKNVSIANPARMLLLLAPVLIAIGHLLRPIIRAMDELTNCFVQLFDVEPKSEITATSTTGEVAFIVGMSAAQGALSGDLRLLSGALELSEESARSIMVPLDEPITLESMTMPAQMECKVAITGFSCSPITNEKGAITDYLHLKDVLHAEAEERDVPAAPWRIRKMGPVNAEDEVEDTLCYMQRMETHCALVIDDARQVLGALFLEDVLEELVGEMRSGLQCDDLIWKRNKERQAFGGDVDRHSASSFRMEPGSSRGTRGSVREGGGSAVRARPSWR